MEPRLGWSKMAEGRQNKKIERKLQQLRFQEEFIRETMVLGIDDEQDTMLKQIQKEKDWYTVNKMNGFTP